MFSSSSFRLFVLLAVGLMPFIPRGDAANCPAITFGPVPFPAKVVPIAAYGASPDTVAVADFNRDKRADVIFCSGKSAYLLLGNGQGGFADPVAVIPTISGVSMTSVRAVDLNRDGFLDLVLGTDRIVVRVALGNGDGTFKPHVDYPAYTAGAPAATVAITGDFDADGSLDLAALLPLAGAVSILPGRGDGTFGAPRTVTATAPNGGLTAGDFNRDGFPDLVTISNGGLLSVLLNRGNGTFLAPTNTQSGVAGAILYAPRPADFNGDGILDLVALSPNQKRLLSYLGKGDGTFTLSGQKTINALGVYTCVLTDINGDGRLDVLVASNTNLSVLEGLGDGTFADELAIPATSVGTLGVGDFNGDGHPDVAVFAGTNAMRILLNETQFLPDIPELRWKQTTGPLRLAWYNTYAGYRLESRSSLAPASPWQAVTNAPTVIDCENFFTVPPSDTAFYRLAKP